MAAAAPGFGRTLALLALFFVLGTPFVAYIWEALNVLIAGRVVPVQLGLATVAAVVLLLILRALAATAQRLDRARAAETGRPPVEPAP